MELTTTTSSYDKKNPELKFKAADDFSREGPMENKNQINSFFFGRFDHLNFHSTVNNFQEEKNEHKSKIFHRMDCLKHVHKHTHKHHHTQTHIWNEK